jgi:cell wall-associated NlpC family hydrolase
MSWYKDYRLIQDGDKFTVEIYLNPDDTEFSGEFFTNIKENVLELDDHIKKLIQDNFNDIKIDTVKLLVGTMLVGSIPFMSYTSAAAADISSTTTAPTASQVVSPASSAIGLIDTTGTVLADILNVRTGPSATYSILGKLMKGSQVEAVGDTNGWYQVKLADGRIGFVSKTYLRLEIPTTTQKINLVITVSNSLIGTPYVWGGTSLQSGGFDCSGFTQYVFKQAGYNLNRVSTNQATQGTYVSKDALNPGDLIFFSIAMDGRISHVGIYLGAGKMIQSPKTGDVVKVTDISTGYWQSRYITARRIIT